PAIKVQTMLTETFVCPVSAATSSSVGLPGTFAVTSPIPPVLPPFGSGAGGGAAGGGSATAAAAGAAGGGAVSSPQSGAKTVNIMTNVAPMRPKDFHPFIFPSLI